MGGAPLTIVIDESTAPLWGTFLQATLRPLDMDRANTTRQSLYGLAPIWWTVEGLGSEYLV